MLTIPALGFATYAESIERALASEPDVEVTHITLKAPVVQKALGRAYPGERGWLNNSIRRRLLWRMHFPYLLRTIREGGYQALHVASQVAGPLALALQKRTGIPYSLGMDTTISLNQGPRPWPRSFEILDRYDRRSLRSAKFVAAFSEWAGTSLRAEYGVKNIIVTPPSLEVAAMRVRAKREAGRPLQLLFIGNDWKRKGGDRLVAWHQQYLREATLHLVSSSAPRLDGMVNVVRHGSMPRDRLIGALLPSVDVLALPTLQDMSPWVIAEAAAAGVGCVSSRIAGIPEQVMHGETGLLCQPDDDAGFIQSFRTLVDHPQRADEYGRAARLLALEKFDARKSYRPILDGLLAS